MIGVVSVVSILGPLTVAAAPLAAYTVEALVLQGVQKVSIPACRM